MRKWSYTVSKKGRDYFIWPCVNSELDLNRVGLSDTKCSNIQKDVQNVNPVIFMGYNATDRPLSDPRPQWFCVIFASNDGPRVF